ncbi:glycosyl hydrolase family 76-domain-containing protein [Aspergillus coremiiformis]|uniref:Mannan endo-1,6-alpha-mannosidase n=1 Tax=Aspergillus coremiiformis TaxID=138285 RepID=A0A5N6ZDZ1_9EURO|nr:glycosyl hydrolase family 76-domain-containing protein [Aspergillus coremiiformis]
MHFLTRPLCASLLLLCHAQTALSDLGMVVNDDASLKKGAQEIIAPMMIFYKQNQTEGIPGKLTDTWYVAGSMFMTLIQYWQASGDDSNNDVVSHDLMFQAGENYDFFSANYSQWLGNDDQMFWGLATITASEAGFPEREGKPSWTSLARAVFNEQVGRWDSQVCGGGMRWQVWPYQAGYQLKNAVSNGGLFALAARLARFTKNNTYTEWADKIWDWSAKSGLLDVTKWLVNDSVNNDDQCKTPDSLQWSYNYGTYLSGAAFMYNYTNGDEKWLKRVNGLLGTTLQTFFPQKYGSNVMSEVACEPIMTCDRNQICFKGYLAMWLAFTSILVPSTKDQIMPKLQGSMEAISKMCNGQSDGQNNLCGLTWGENKFDGVKGLEAQMAALGGVTANMMLLTAESPNTIDSNPGAKEHNVPSSGSGQDPSEPKPITTADRAGAWILMVIMVAGITGSVGWLVKP